MDFLAQAIPDVDAIAQTIERLDFINQLVLVIVLLIILVMVLIGAAILMIRASRQSTGEDNELQRNSFEIIKIGQTNFNTSVLEFQKAIQLFQTTTAEAQEDRSKVVTWLEVHEFNAERRYRDFKAQTDKLLKAIERTHQMGASEDVKTRPILPFDESVD